MTEKDLLELKEQIEDAKTETSELKGHLKAQMKQLKDTWKCNTVKEAEKMLVQMEKSIKSYNESIEQGLKELEEEHGS
jgi:uncharacterized protein YukE